MMDRYIVTIGSIKIEWYSVLILVGAMIAITMIMKEAKRYNYPTDFVFNMCFWRSSCGIGGCIAPEKAAYRLRGGIYHHDHPVVCGLQLAVKFLLDNLYNKSGTSSCRKYYR